MARLWFHLNQLVQRECRWIEQSIELSNHLISELKNVILVEFCLMILTEVKSSTAPAAPASTSSSSSSSSSLSSSSLAAVQLLSESAASMSLEKQLRAKQLEEELSADLDLADLQSLVADVDEEDTDDLDGIFIYHNSSHTSFL